MSSANRHELASQPPLWSALFTLIFSLLLLSGCEVRWDKLGKDDNTADPEKVLPWKQKQSAKEPGSPAEAPEDTAVIVGGKYMDFQDIFADVAEKVIPGVVSIYSERDVKAPEGGDAFNSPFHYFFDIPQQRQPRRETGLGSGVIISPMGFILTNNHVIEGADVINVQLSDGTEYDAEIVGTDAPSDLAVIKIKKDVNNLPVVELGDSEKLRIGEWVVAVGNPYGLSHTVTTGIISAKERSANLTRYENFLQTDAAINPGNSGGAMVNLQGRLVGINTAILSRSGGYQGIGLAIPINMAKKITEDLIEKGEVVRGWLGVQIQTPDQDMAEALGLEGKKGALVSDVMRNSPAEEAGLKRGDVILQVEGKSVKDATELMHSVALLEPNSKSQFTIFRDGKERKMTVKIGRRDKKTVEGFEQSQTEGTGEKDERLGMELSNLTPTLKQQFNIDRSVVTGVVITQVEAGTQAARSGLRPGDVIVEVKGRKVNELSELKQYLDDRKAGEKLLMLINRQGNTFYIALTAN